MRERSTRSGPDSRAAPFPPEGFDANNYAHVSAWRQVLPNFFANGQWWSSRRFGIVARGPTGEDFAVHELIDPGPRTPTEIKVPSIRPNASWKPRRVKAEPYVPRPGDPETFDPVDWDELLPEYLMLRDRLLALGDGWMSDGWMTAYREKGPQPKPSKLPPGLKSRQ